MNWDVRVIGVDLHGRTLEFAREQVAGEARIRLLCADALRLPFEAGSFDYALSSMFLHHLSDADAVSALVEMDRVASRGVIAADLLRRPVAYWGIRFLTHFSSPMVRHDARVSVLQAFTRQEICTCEPGGRWLAAVPQARVPAVCAGRGESRLIEVRSQIAGPPGPRWSLCPRQVHMN